MTNIADLVLNDGTDDLTFEPHLAGSRSEWVNLASDTTNGRSKAVTSVSLAGQGNKRETDKTFFKLVFPVEGEVDGQTTVLGVDFATVDITYRKDCPAAERTVLFTLLMDALADTQVQSALVSLKPTT